MRIRLSSIALIAAISLTSCVKEMMVSDHMVTSKGFTAVMADVPETKTALQGSHVVWSANDTVAIFKNSTLPTLYHVLRGTEGSTDCTLRRIEEFGAYTEDGTSRPEYRIDDVVAYYPMSEVSSITKSGSSYSLDVTLPETQIYVADSFGPGALPMVAVTNGADNTQLQFRNVLGFLRLDLVGNVPVKKIVVRGNAGEKLSGKAVVTASNSDVPTVTMSAAAADSVVLSGGASYVDCNSGSNIYIAIPPVTFTRGITVTIETPWGTITKSTSSSLEIKRSAVTSMETLSYMTDAPMVPDNEIWYIAYEGNPLASFNVGGGINVISNEVHGGFGVIRFDGPVKEILRVSNARGVYLPDSIESIGSYAFNSMKFDDFTFPKSLKSIGSQAFNSCTFSSLTIPDSIETLRNTMYSCRVEGKIIGKYASADNKFWIENGDLLLAANCPDIVIPDGVVSIGDYAFASHSKVETVSVPSSCENIGDYAFSSCANLKSIKLSEGLRTVGYSSFANCISLETISFPKSLESLGYRALQVCPGLKSIIFAGSNCMLDGDFLGDYPDFYAEAYGDMNLETLTLPEHLDTYSLYLNNLPKLKSVVIPEGVSSVDLSGCSSLQSVTMPSTLVGISLDGCTSLQSVTLPSTLEYISLDGCTSLQSLAGPNVTADGKTLIKDGKLVFTMNKEDETIVIPEGVTSIEAGTYMGNTTIKRVVFPQSLKLIGSSAFEGCTNLDNVILPDGLEEIDYKAFFGCSSLSGITIPESVEVLGSGAFSNCTSIARFAGRYASSDGQLLVKNIAPNWHYIVSAVTSIKYCSYSLTSYYQSHITVDDYSFYGCKLLESVMLFADDVGVYESAFEGCVRLTTIETTNPISAIQSRAFAYCKSLASICMYDEALVSGSEAFLNCTGLSDVRFAGHSSDWVSNGGRSSLPISCFEGCKHLSSIVIPDMYGRSIGYSCFKGCTSLRSCALPEGLMNIDSNAFYECRSLDLDLPRSVSSIGNSAFAFSGIRAIDLSCVTSFGANVFESCSSLRSITLSPGLSSIAVGLFKNSGITSITLPDSIKYIYSEAFSGCQNLQRITLECFAVPEVRNASAFENNAADRVFVVPSYMYDAYQGDKSWSQFKNQIVKK